VVVGVTSHVVKGRQVVAGEQQRRGRTSSS
jgi:hypothetical protein